jgi:hypothetical protein
MIDGARFGDVIISGAYYTVLDSGGEYYRLGSDNGPIGWFFKDGFEEVPV